MSIHLVIGSMYSGKTDEIIRNCKRFSRIKPSDRILCINHSFDTRFDDNDIYPATSIGLADEMKKLTSHGGSFYEQSIRVAALEHVKKDVIIKAWAICVNEAQFFDDLVKYVTLWADVMGKHVYVGGLDGDFARRPFGKIGDLIPHCTSVNKLRALCDKCKDGTEGIFSHRITEGKEQILVGKSESYVSLCREHYNEAVGFDQLYVDLYPDMTQFVDEVKNIVGNE